MFHKFFNEQEVTSSLIMDIIYFGLKIIKDKSRIWLLNVKYHVLIKFKIDDKLERQKGGKGTTSSL